MSYSVLITGGAGFIGSHLCEKFIQLNYEVICIDNLFRGKKENLNKLITNNKFHFCNIDINSHNSIIKISEIIIKYKPSYILHYAAINGTEYFYDIPYEVVITNSLTTSNLLEAIKLSIKDDNSYKPKLVFASSSEVYGSAKEIPTDENSITYLRPNEDRDSYAAGKLISEFYIKLFSKKYNLEFFIIRIFNVYGPRMISTKYGQVIPELIEKIKFTKTNSIELIGSGLETRSFCYIEDHINLTIKLIFNGRSCEIYNLGNCEEISIFDVAKNIEKILNKKIQINSSKQRSGDHNRRCPDINKLIKSIGSYEFISLDDGIKKMIKD